jgi:hypothetical protein
LKLEGQSGASSHGQRNVQSDVQALLAPLTQSEEAGLSLVRINWVELYFFKLAIFGAIIWCNNRNLGLATVSVCVNMILNHGYTDD